MSEAGDSCLHVPLDHMQPKSWSRDYTMTSRSAILVAKFKIKLQEPELTAKMPGKCSFQDHWLKDSAYQEWVLKNELDKNCLRRSMQNSAHF